MATTFANGNAKSRLTTIGAIATAMLAALFAFAIAAPGNASAFTYASNTYHIADGETVTLDKHDPTQSLTIFVDGDVTIDGDIYGEARVDILPEESYRAAYLTINGEVYGDIVEIEGYGQQSMFDVTINGASYGSITATSKLTVQNAFLTVKGPWGISSYGDATINNATVRVETTKSAYGRYGLECGGTLSVKSGSHVEATGYDKGVWAQTIVADSAYLKGKAKRTTTLGTGKYAYGIQCNDLTATNDSSVNGYAYAGIKTFSTSKPRSFGIFVREHAKSTDSELYAYNKGKYGVGLAAAHLSTYGNYDEETDSRTSNLYASAKNYGVGIMSRIFPPTVTEEDDPYVPGFDPDISLRRTDAKIYGGKYGVYTMDARFHTGSSDVKVYATNLKGTRTGHGIYVKNSLIYLEYSDIYVKAKNSKSYYGIYASGKPTASGVNVGTWAEASTVKVYGYSSKAFRYKVGSGSVKKGVVRDSVLYINGKKQTGYPISLD